jgi:hypothetical protein
LDYRYAAALIVVIQVIAVDPAVIAFPIDIAPAPVIETSVEIQQGVGRYGGDQGIIGTGSGAQMHGTLGVRIGCPNGGAVQNSYEADEQH